VQIVILGAGSAGLAAGYHLNKYAQSDVEIFEANQYSGGLSASFVDPAGFTWDVGGHVLFSHYPHFDQIVEVALEGQYYSHQRESWVRV
jgi:protoporphyrinogen oxidase